MQLVQPNDPVLYQATKFFDFSEHNATEVVEKMAEIMFKEHGIGLAGPQVGFPYSVFVMQWTDNNAIGVFNPVIKDKSNNIVKSAEGCLSFPFLMLTIPRPESCSVQFTTSEQKIIEADLTGIHARCFLHEYDHLHGKVFQSYVSNLSLNIARRKRNKFFKKTKKYAYNK